MGTCRRAWSRAPTWPRPPPSLAARLAAGPTLAYAESKRAIAAATLPPLDDVLAAEAQAQGRLGQSRDHADAVAAFLAKRKPEFHGR